MFHNAQIASAFSDDSFVAQHTNLDEHADHQSDHDSIETEAHDFARMCKAYETGERILFKLDNYSAASITRGLELLRNCGLIARSVELQTRKVNHRSFDSYVVLVRAQMDSCTNARTASFRASMSYCRFA